MPVTPNPSARTRDSAARMEDSSHSTLVMFEMPGIDWRPSFELAAAIMIAPADSRCNPAVASFGKRAREVAHTRADDFVPRDSH